MTDRYYQTHWQDIEPDRLDRYEKMFVWRPEQDPLLAPLALKAGQTVIDFGCGPGFLAAEIARRVGAGGKVYGLDLNAEFIARARTRAAADGLSQLDFVQLTGARAPLGDGVADALICKNVLEYVPDAAATIAEHYRLLRSGGRIEILDSDWRFLLVEPWGPDETETFFAAAGGAFNERLIGRKIAGLLARTGFTNIDVSISAFADRKGNMRPVLMNMASYIRTLGTKPADYVEARLGDVEAGIADGTYLFVLPQFQVTADKP